MASSSKSSITISSLSISQNIKGTSKADILVGGGRKTLAGGLGDDIYELLSADDTVVESAGQGTDTVRIRYAGAATLAANVENMELLGVGSTTGIGNALANRITAGATHATLDGLKGNDTLVGGAGADLYKVSAGNGSDTIVNFQSGFDTIRLDGYGVTTFAALQSLARQVRGDVVIKFKNGETLTLRDTALSSLSAYDFGLQTAPARPAGFSPMNGAGKAVNIGGWTALNNTWGSGKLAENTDYSVKTNFNSNDLTSGTTFSWSYAFSTELSQTIKAFPELFFGSSPYGSPNPTDLVKAFPIQLSAINSLVADFAVSFRGNTGGFDVSFDLTLTKVPNGKADSVTNEIAVLLHKPDVPIAGTLVGEYSDGTIHALIYHGGINTVVVPDKDWPQGQLDIAGLFARLVELGIVSKDAYLATVQLGAQVYNGAGELTIKDLDLVMESIDGSGHVLSTVVTGKGTTVTDITPPAPQEPVVEAIVPDLAPVPHTDAKLSQPVAEEPSYSLAIQPAQPAVQAPISLNLIGAAGSDTLVGGLGSDRLAGGQGADVLTGNGGSDTFVFGKKGGADVVTDFTAKGAGADVVEINGYAFAKFEHLQAFIKQSGADTVITLSGTDSVTLKGVTASDLTAANFAFTDVAAPSAGKLAVGINLTGAEYIGPTGQKTGIDYFPTTEEIEYFAAKGMNEFRIPIAWESLQPTLGGSLDAGYLAKLKEVVAYAKSLGVNAIIDLHNAGAYQGKLIGTTDVPVSAFSDVWSRLATEFKAADNVRFDLMNEPQQATAADWLPIANAGIAAIRATGAAQQILVPGTYWDGAQSWTTSDNAAVIGAPGAIVDPLNNFVFQVHLYLDDTSGTNSWVVSPTIGIERLTAVTDWARAAGVKLFLGELGAASDPAALTALDNTMAYLKANEDVWQGVTYFAAGPAWHDYMFAVEPDLGLLDVAQMDVLEKYIDTTTTRTALADGTYRIDTFGHGASLPSISDVFDQGNALVSRTIYDTTGGILGKLVKNADGTIRVDDYDPKTGHLEDVKVYDSAHHVLKDSVYAADQSYVTTVYNPASGSVVRNEKHAADGRYIEVTEVTATSNILSHYYDNGSIKQLYTYDMNWSLIDGLQYDEAGQLTQHIFPSMGHILLDVYGQNGQVTSRGEYTSSWVMLEWTTYNGDGSMTTAVHNADGTKDIELFSAGATEPYKVDHFAADGSYLGTILG